MPVKGTAQQRKEYERERKQRKRIQQIMQLPEPERTQALQKNEQRRNQHRSWQWDKKRKDW